MTREELPPISNEITLRRIRVDGFKSLRDVELEFSGRNPLVLVGANGAGKTNVIELFLFLRRALHDELRRRPYAPHAEWGGPRSLTWEGEARPIQVRLEYELRFRRGEKEARWSLVYDVSFAPDASFSTIMPVHERIEIPELSYVIERRGTELRITMPTSSRDAVKALLALDEGINEANCKAGMCTLVKSLGKGRDDVPAVLASPTVVFPISYRGEHHAIYFVIFANGDSAAIPFPRNAVNVGIADVFSLLNEWFSRIIVIRQIDYGAAKWPHNRYPERLLRPRGENLAEALYEVMRSPEGRERVEAALATLFPWLEVRVEFNEYGQIGLVFYERRGDRHIRLYPAMVPDGVLKLLALIAAVAMRPSVLAVDEIENSLHAAIIDYVMRELEDLEDPVIIATHSPVVVDLAGPERTLLLSRGPDGATRVEKLAPRKLWQRIREEGIALSDYYIHAAT